MLLIFELDRDLYEIHLRRKFHDNWMSLSKVIVLTAGRPDILTDSRVYSLFEYTKKVIVLKWIRMRDIVYYYAEEKKI